MSNKHPMLREACVVATGVLGKQRFLFKNRDRNYKPEITVVHELRDGVEIAYLKDAKTGWCEGLNEYGIGVVNSALMVSRDESERDEVERTGKTLGDGERILKALTKKSVTEAAKSIRTYKGGLKGHTLIADQDQALAVELPDSDQVEYNDVSKDLFVRTNHGVLFPDAGYVSGDREKSSKKRQRETEKVLEGVETPQEVAPALLRAREDRWEPTEVVRDGKSERDMRTCSQMVLNLAEKKLTLYLLPGRCTWKGIDSEKAPEKPEITIEVLEYRDLSEKTEGETMGKKASISDFRKYAVTFADGMVRDMLDPENQGDKFTWDRFDQMCIRMLATYWANDSGSEEGDTPETRKQIREYVLEGPGRAVAFCCIQEAKRKYKVASGSTWVKAYLQKVSALGEAVNALSALAEQEGFPISIVNKVVSAYGKAEQALVDFNGPLPKPKHEDMFDAKHSGSVLDALSGLGYIVRERGRWFEEIHQEDLSRLLWVAGSEAMVAPSEILKQKVDKTAEAKYKKKREVPKADGKGTTIVYEYSEKQIEHRHREKAKRYEGLSEDIEKLRKQVLKDMESEEPEKRLTALAVALIDATFERVGNAESADDGHFGVTGWLKKHLTFKGSKAIIKYVGKSGVSHEKEVSNAKLVKALKGCCDGKGPDDPILSFGKDDSEGSFQISSEDVNEYLSPFEVTAKDLRGFHANATMQEELKKVRKAGPDLPKDRKEKDKILKKEFKKALEATAEAVGHESATLRTQYLVPGMEDQYLKDGTVIENLKNASLPRWKKAHSQGELEQRVETLIWEYQQAGETGASKKELGAAFRKWFLEHYDIERNSTPKGGKALKDKLQLFLWEASYGPSSDNMYNSGNLIKDWAYLKQHLAEIEQWFSVHKQEFVPEVRTSIATYKNQVGLAGKTFTRFVERLDQLFQTLKGWRAKALSGGFTVVLAGPDHFRGTSKGRYNSASDTLWVRATTQILQRAAASYGSIDYILIHELGHRYERFFGSRSAPITTPYSMRESTVPEAFAEAFALGHFGIYSHGSLDFKEALLRWEQQVRVGTKTPAEREEEEITRLVKPNPNKKPPRKDRDRRIMQLEETEEKDKDLSLNYKDV